MELHQALTEKSIWLGAAGASKWKVLETLVQRLAAACGESVDAILGAVIEREQRSSTGVGGGIAIPHARTNCVSKVDVALAISPAGIDFDSLDGKPCHLVFLVVAPTDASTRYLDALASIASIGVNPAHVEGLLRCTSAAQVLERLHAINGKHRTAHGGR